MTIDKKTAPIYLPHPFSHTETEETILNLLSLVLPSHLIKEGIFNYSKHRKVSSLKVGATKSWKESTSCGIRKKKPHISI